MIIDHPTNTACHYDEEFELRCTAKSRSGKNLIFQWITGKYFLATVATISAMSWSLFIVSLSLSPFL